MTRTKGPPHLRVRSGTNLATAAHVALAAAVLAMGGCETIKSVVGPGEPRYGAIAYSPASRDWRFRWNVESPQRAAQLARSDCRDAACRVVLAFGPDQCGTLSLGRSAYGVGVGSSRAAAEKAALARCQASGQACRVAPAECNS